MKMMKNALILVLSLCLLCAACPGACAVTFTDAHGNVIELDDSLEAYAGFALYGADNAARGVETNLGDLWTDALRWFAASGAIDEYFEEDDVTAGNTGIAVDSGHIVALWNGGNLRADIAEGKFGAEQLAQVLPYPNKVAVVYMTGAQLQEALADADIVLSAVDSARPVVTQEMCSAVADRNVLFVDLGVPRNIDPFYDDWGHGVTVADLDDLKLWHRVNTGVLNAVRAKADAVIRAEYRAP
jgi:hypothetical protein